MCSSNLRLRPPIESDAVAFAAAHEALRQEDFEFGPGFDPSVPFADFIESMADARHGRNLLKGRVAESFLLGIVDDSIVGRVSVRFALNEFLSAFGGHIGYAVLPEYRRRGLATDMLSQALVIARAEGVDRVLVTCNDDNVGSAKTIERNSGVLGNRVPRPGGGLTRRYWID